MSGGYDERDTRDSIFGKHNERIAELEAQCAAMREAWLKERDWFERANKSMAARSEVSDGLMFQWPQIHDASQRALAPDAGKALLRRLARAEEEAARPLAGIQALEEAAKVAEAMAEKEEGYLADHGIDIARAIRALKEK